MNALFHAPADVLALQVTVSERLQAYDIDRNPRHVLEAWRALRAAGMHPGGEILRYMDQAVEQLRPPGCRRRPQFSVRDVQILAALDDLLNTREIPRMVPHGVMVQLGARFNVRPSAVAMAVSRLRKRQRRASRSK